MMNNSDKKQKIHEIDDFNEKINELRHTFEDTVSLNNTLESKASSFIGFSALIISVILFTLNSILTTPSKGLITNFWIQIIFYFSVVAVIIIIGWGLVKLKEVIDLRVYSYPFSYDPNKMYRIIEKPFDEFRDEIITDYRLAISHHAGINKIKKDLLHYGINYLSVGFMASVIIMLVLIGLKLAGGAYG